MIPEQRLAAPAERFAKSDGLRIRYLDNAVSDADTALPVLFVPGITDFAEDYLEMFGLFERCRLVVAELRGRGGSDAPTTGYSAAAQAGDVAAVADDAGLVQFHLMTFSRGTTAAIEFALSCPARVASLAIGDYRPGEIGLPEAFVDQQWATRWRGRPIPERVRRHVLEGIQAESVSRQLWDEVAGLGVPVLVARGDSGGLIDDALEATYRDRVPGVEVVTIPGAGHDLFRPDRGAFPLAVLDFIARRVPGA